MQVKWAINIQLTFYNKGKELKVSTNQYSLNIEYNKRKILSIPVEFLDFYSLKVNMLSEPTTIFYFKSKTIFTSQGHFLMFSNLVQELTSSFCPWAWQFHIIFWILLSWLLSHPCWFTSCILRVSKCRMKYVVAFQTFICIDKLSSKLRNYSCPIKKIQNKPSTIHNIKIIY